MKPNLTLAALLALAAPFAHAHVHTPTIEPLPVEHPLAAAAGEEAHAHTAPKKRAWIKRVFRRVPRSTWDGVDPALQAKLEPIYQQLRKEGFDVRPVEGFRSEERQASLSAAVTQVGPGRSCHNHGFAMDSAVYRRGRPTWDLKDPTVRAAYERYGTLATQAGLRWGGHWKQFQDMPHVELRTPCLLAIRNRFEGDRLLAKTPGRALMEQREALLDTPPLLTERFAVACTEAGCRFVRDWWGPAWAMSPAVAWAPWWARKAVCV